MSDDVASKIGQTQAAYARCIDNGDLDAWPEFFTEQCVYKITTADNHSQGLEAGVVFANSRAMLVDRITSLREANVYERHTYRHFLGQPWIKSKDGARVASETPFFVIRIMRDGLARGDSPQAHRETRTGSAQNLDGNSVPGSPAGARHLHPHPALCQWRASEIPGRPVSANPASRRRPAQLLSCQSAP